MPDHPTQIEFDAYLTRTLSAREIYRLDRHLAQCSLCLGQVLQRSAPGAAQRMLRAIGSSGPHLTYEDLEGLVDGNLQASRQSPLTKHLAQCKRCAAELSEMQGYAKEFSRSLTGAPEKGGTPLSKFLGWMPTQMVPQAAMAVLVGAVALTLLLRHSGDLAPVGPADDAAKQIKMQPPPPRAAPRREFDRSALGDLGQLSSKAWSAYRMGDYAATARLLQPLADKGNPQAQSALGLLLAEGRGVNRDLKAAEQLWLLAAKQGNAAATQNLRVLYENPQ